MCGDSKTTTDTTSNTTRTPTNAPWVTALGGDVGNQLGALFGHEYGTPGYNPGSQYVAPASSLQQQGFTNAGLLGSSWQDALTSAQGATKSLLTPTANTAALPSTPTASLIGTPAQASASTVKSLISGDGLDGYINPFLDSVVKSTLADYDEDAGAKTAAARAYSAKSGATGGSGNALFTAGLMSDLARGRATTESGLRSDAFDKGTALASGDADRLTQTSEFNAGQANTAAAADAQARNTLAALGYTTTAQNSEFNAGQSDTALNRVLSAAGLLGNLGTAAGDQARQDVNSQLAGGQVQRGIDADQRAGELNFLQYLQSVGGVTPGLFAGTNQDTTSKTTETTMPSLLDSIGKALAVSQSLSGGASKLFNNNGTFTGGGGQTSLSGGGEDADLLLG